jgi:5-methylcytosine-specific restriction endonuclease McrA
MWARRTKTAKRNAYGVATIRRDTYNTRNGMSFKSGDGWWTISAEVRKRSRGKCEARRDGVRCGAPAKDVHHIIPLSKGGANTLSNLIHLCDDCHSRRHRHLFKSRGTK